MKEYNYYKDAFGEPLNKGDRVCFLLRRCHEYEKYIKGHIDYFTKDNVAIVCENNGEVECFMKRPYNVIKYEAA